MVRLKDLLYYTQELMQVDCFKDYCPNGLQVEGKMEVEKIVSGVTANMALFEAAKLSNADLILVHHGFFWRNEDPRVIGIKRNRLAFLLNNDLNLMAYHLPLDAHVVFGNNVQFGRVLGIDFAGFTGESNIIAYGDLVKPISLKEFTEQIEFVLQRKPLVIGNPKKVVKKVAWCTGAAQGYIDVAI